MLFSQPDFLSHIERTEGFKQKLTEICPAIKIFEPFCTYESDAIAYQVVTNLIQEHDDLSGIFVAGGGQIGAGDALNDSGKGNEIKMICFDLLPQTVNHVKNGVVDFTIGQDPFIQGYMPVKLMYEYLAYGTRPKREYLYTNIDIRVKDNISYKGFEVFTGSYMSEI